MGVRAGRGVNRDALGSLPGSARECGVQGSALPVWGAMSWIWFLQAAIDIFSVQDDGVMIIEL